MEDTPTTKIARLLVEAVGYNAALADVERWRDDNSPGTFSFSLANQVHKRLREFATVGHTSKVPGFTQPRA